MPCTQATLPWLSATDTGGPSASAPGVATVKCAPVSRFRASSAQAPGFTADVACTQTSHGGSTASAGPAAGVTTRVSAPLARSTAAIPLSPATVS